MGKHNPRKSKWTKVSRKLHGKEMELDSTFDFEKKRNVPTKYDRNVWVKTMQAMKTIDKIRQTRTERFHKQRLGKMMKVHRAHTRQGQGDAGGEEEGPAQGDARGQDGGGVEQACRYGTPPQAARFRVPGANSASAKQARQ